MPPLPAAYNEDVKFTMYRIGRHPRHHYMRYAIAGVICLGLVAVTAIATHGLRANMVLHQSQSITQSALSGSDPEKPVITAQFTMSLPASWKRVGSTTNPYTWRGVIGDAADRPLDLYLDTVPANLAVNRLLPVQADGQQLELIGPVSDNCVNFTDRSTENQVTGTAPARWTGVDFICDLANNERNVSAIGSMQGVNTVTLDSASSVSHRVLLVYTDNSASPDYAAFQTAATSLRLL